MAEIGLGYGSEYQLLRFLGHHREELNSKILECTGFTDSLLWMDYPYDNSKISLDGEYKGIEFLRNEDNFNYIENEWKAYWPQTGNSQNWDGIIICGSKYIMVEAKAHIDEIYSSFSGTSNISREIIDNAFIATRKKFGIETVKDWFNKFYQFSNRLAFLNFMESVGLESYLLNIYFIDGYDKRVHPKENKNVKTITDWKNVLDKQYDFLGIEKSHIEGKVFNLFINCTK